MTTNPNDGLRTIGECAKFFAMSVEWIRFHEAAGHFRYEDGGRIEPLRFLTEEGKLGVRYYDLDMIELMANSLKKAYVINKYDHERTMNVIKAYRALEEK